MLRISIIAILFTATSEFAVSQILRDPFLPSRQFDPGQSETWQKSTTEFSCWAYDIPMTLSLHAALVAENIAGEQAYGSGSRVIISQSGSDLILSYEYELGFCSSILRHNSSPVPLLEEVRDKAGSYVLTEDKLAPFSINGVALRVPKRFQIASGSVNSNFNYIEFFSSNGSETVLLNVLSSDGAFVDNIRRQVNFLGGGNSAVVENLASAFQLFENEDFEGGKLVVDLGDILARVYVIGSISDNLSLSVSIFGNLNDSNADLIAQTILTTTLNSDSWLYDHQGLHS